jgi:hypothetical protein
LIIQYFNMNRNKYKKYVLQNLSSEHIILKFYYKIVKCFFWIKDYFLKWDHNYCILIHSVCHWKSFRVPRLARMP